MNRRAAQARTRWGPLVAAGVLLLGAAVGRAQAPGRTCLGDAEVRALQQDRGGQTWAYAVIDRGALQAARCVTRSGDTLRIASADGQERVVQWVGTPQHGHWYRIRRIGTGFERYADRNEARLPPVTAIYAAVFLSDAETLMIVRLIPPLQRIAVPWTIEYQAYVNPAADPSLPIVWPAAAKGLDYRAVPRRTGSGAIDALYGYNGASMSAAEAEAFHRHYSPVVADFVEARFFDRPYPVSLMQTTLPGVGPVAIRAGATIVPPQAGRRPPEEIAPVVLADAPSFVFVHVIMGRPLDREVTVVHRVQAMRGATAAYRFVADPEEWRTGWAEYWLQHSVPPGRLPPGAYTVDWHLGATLAARIPLVVEAR
jgi:hypothetical protein